MASRPARAAPESKRPAGPVRGGGPLVVVTALARRRSGLLDVDRARALGALLDVELDGLAAVERLELGAGLEAAPMEEELLVVVGGDEAEPAVCDDALDCACGHARPPVMLPERGVAERTAVRRGATRRIRTSCPEDPQPSTPYQAPFVTHP